jgi:thiol:disulfide interchange protein DsbD
MMFAMALGMGVPLLLLGLGAGKLLPKAGAWMDKIKYLFGALLLAVAIYLFSILDIVSPLILWGVYLIGLSILMGAFDGIEAGKKLEKFAKMVGIVMFIWGILLLVGGANGNHDIYKPLAQSPITYIQNPETNQVQQPEKLFADIHNMQELDRQLARAKEEEKAVMIYFNHDACPVCKRLKDTTWKDKAVRSLLNEKFIALSVNMTDKSDEDIQAIKNRFSIFGPPGFVFFDSEGDELEDDSFYGYQAPTEMVDILDLIAG